MLFLFDDVYISNRSHSVCIIFFKIPEFVLRIFDMQVHFYCLNRLIRQVKMFLICVLLERFGYITLYLVIGLCIYGLILYPCCSDKNLQIIVFYVALYDVYYFFFELFILFFNFRLVEFLQPLELNKFAYWFSFQSWRLHTWYDRLLDSAAPSLRIYSDFKETRLNATFLRKN